MSVRMRLRRMGAKHQPSYRIVIANSTAPRDGRYIDQIGFYNPRPNPAIINVNREKAIEWLRKGAEPTETVEILLKKFGITPEAARKGQLSAEPAGSTNESGEETQTINPNEAPNPESGE